MPKTKRKAPSQTWMTFLRNHRGAMASVDLTVVTATFGFHYVLIVLSHDRRRVLHFSAMAHPSAGWTARQALQAFPGDIAPRYLLRDWDGIYGEAFRRQVRQMGVRELLISRASPGQNPFAERPIGSLRRECPDHVLILGEDQLRRVVSEYIACYHHDPTHDSLGKDAPFHRPILRGHRTGLSLARYLAWAGCMTATRGGHAA